MSRGIVRIKPHITAKGSLELDEITQPEYSGMRIGTPLVFQNPEPAFTVNVGSLVECDILSDSSCRITRVIQY